jgi:hypothetical protein
MFQTCLFAISLFISFALSCNLPNVIYYSTSYKRGIPLFNDNYNPVGYYNKISNNRFYNNYRHVLLFDVQTFYYYFSFYMMYFFYRLTTIMLSKLLEEQLNYNKKYFLNSVIKKRTGINMNDTYYIPTCEEEEGGEGEGSCGEDCEECWERRDKGEGGEEGGEEEGEGSESNEEEGEKEGGGEKEDGEEDGSGEGEGSNEEDGSGEEEGECIECNDENCTYFSIDNKCKIKCISCEQ